MKWSTVIYLVLFALMLWGVEHKRRDLWEPDEARYAYVAREMMQDGHWAVPHRHGDYYAHKPPLYFWMIRGVVKLTGQPVNGVTARIPSLLGTIVSLIVTGLFAVRLFGSKALWPSCLILSTSFLFWHEGGMGRMDSVLLALELSALYLLIRGDEKRSSASTMLGYSMMGLGVLAKGPVGLLVPLIAYVVIRKIKDDKLFASHMSWGVPLALLFPLCWLGAAWAEGASIDYFKELIFKQNIGRVAGTASFGKPRPFYFYLLHVPAEFMPWTVFLPASIIALKKAGRKVDLQLLIGWALSVIIFFSLSSGKRNLYVLLAYPAMSIMVGGAWSYMSELSERWKKNTVVAAAVVMILLGLAESTIGLWYQLPISGGLLIPSAVALLAGALVALVVYSRKGVGRLLVYVFAGAFVLHHMLVANLVYPALNPHKTPVEVIAVTKPYSERGEKMIIYGSTSEIMPLYCNMSSINAVDPDELRQKMRDERTGVIVFREESWLELSPILRYVEVIGESTIGHKKMVLVHFGNR